MELLLVPVILLVVMYAAWRSIVAGLAIAGLVACVAAPQLGQSGLVTVAGGASSGILLGLLGRGTGAPGAGSLLLGATPLAAGLVLRSIFWDRELLRVQLVELVELQAGNRVTAETQRELVDLLLGVAPASEALFGWGVTILCYVLAGRLFPRLGVKMRQPEPLARFRWPFFLIWSFALALVMLITGHAFGEQWIFLGGLNLVLVHGTAFFFEGLAVARFVAEAQGMPRLAQVFLALFALVIPPLPFLVAGIGFFDLWFDFRRHLASLNSNSGADSS